MHYTRAYISFKPKGSTGTNTTNNSSRRCRRGSKEHKTKVELSAQEKVIVSKVRSLSKNYCSEVAKEAEFMLSRVGNQLRQYVRDKIKAELVFVMMANGDV